VREKALMSFGNANFGVDFYRKQGISGLYRGMEAKLLQTVLTAALMFLVYEKIARFVFRLLLHKPVLR